MNDIDSALDAGAIQTPHQETTLERYQREYRKQTEGKIVKRLCRTLAASGWAPTHVWDSEEDTPATTTAEVLDLLANLDMAHVHFQNTEARKAGWVYIINGNEWDAISDYTTNLEPAIAPVNAWIEAHW